VKSELKESSISVSETLGSGELKIQVNKLAPQANGTALVSLGDTVVLATAVMSKGIREGIDYLPLLVDYEERLYAAGKISGSRFVKREGRPTEAAILSGRLADRSLRPLFPKNFYNDIQVILTTLSVDGENDPDIVSLIAASCALACSDIPFEGPIGAVRIGRIDGEWVINPTYEAREKSEMDLVVSGKENEIIMIEAASNEVPEQTVKDALKFSQTQIKKIIALQKKVIEKIGKAKIKVGTEGQEELPQEIKKFLTEKKISTALYKDKLERDAAFQTLREETKDFIDEKFGDDKNLSSFRKQALIYIEDETKRIMRKRILEEGVRADLRKPDEIRPLTSGVSLLPRTHGTGKFQRGYTQVLTIATLGSIAVEQTLDGIEPETKKRYMHHYNFPPFSVGEVSPLRSASRREIGHGALAEKALLPVLPSREDFPYTIRLVSEVLSSDGSTSMGSTCGSTLALMDAGVPIKAPVGGISIGIIKEGEKYELLTDISGIEDFYGDMDFKVTGTKSGVTAIQMDLKLKGLSVEILSEAIDKAKAAREIILAKITETIASPRAELSPFAPRFNIVEINPDKIRDLIGPGGKVINKIIADTGVEIDIEDSGKVFVFSKDAKMAKAALAQINAITEEVEVGKIYQGKVTRIMDFGAFVEVLPNQEGLVHISKLADYRVDKVEDIVKLGDIIPVKVTEIDSQGRINLSYKDAVKKP